MDVLAYINGEWSEGQSWIDNLSPADTREPIGRVAQCATEQLDAAVAAAKSASAEWRATPAPKRGQIVFAAMRLLQKRADVIAEWLTKEEGKILRESRGELQKTINLLEFIAGEGRRFGGEVMPSEMSRTLCYTTRQPLGVVGLITPWNFPVAIPAWKIAPALVAGNTIVFKPAEQTPITARMVVEAFVEAGLPRGVLNMVCGTGETVGRRLVDHPDVAAISFTGSNEVGSQIAARAAQLHKKCQCEMGGKNPLVVFTDADLELAAAATADGAFGSTGQRCTATSRAIVHRDVAQQFVDLVRQRAEAFRVGDPLDDAVDMGPSIDSQQYEQVHRFIGVGNDEGAELVCGGRKLTDGALAHGYYTQPTIFAGVKPTMRIAQEEIFGPVLSVLTFDDFDEAMRLTNGVRFGLSSSVYTRDLCLAHRFVELVETGITHINSPTLGGEAQLPFGGIKATGVGEREMGTTAVEFYSELKTVYVDYTGAGRGGNLY